MAIDAIAHTDCQGITVEGFRLTNNVELLVRGLFSSHALLSHPF
jgi:hypothetical protein